MTSAKTTTSPKPLAGATPMQLRQHQVDVWQNRHNFHHVMTPGTRAAATDMAIEADHIEALEMNANDDSGREAFFAASDKLMAPDKTARESVIRDGMTSSARSNPQPQPFAEASSAKQFCRKCLKNCTPAVTLTFDDGARRLHWCAEHASCADEYRPDADQAPRQPADRGARESVIRDLYALVAFYVANPEFPLPEFISVHTYVPVEQVEAIAAERGTRVYGTCPQTHIDLPGTSRKVTIFAVTNRGGRI